jgi:hypothetical protein
MEEVMLNGISSRPLAAKTALLIAALVSAMGAAMGSEGKYPDLRGQWTGVLRSRPGIPGQASFDPGKPGGKGQDAPLTPEYQAIWETDLKRLQQGGLVDWRGPACLGFGMPQIAYGFQPMEFIITPETTYVLVNWVEHTRRIYTDGRDWPAEIEPTLTGYSIGQWIDERHDGRNGVLEVETRGFKGPRYYDADGLPLHHDNQSVFKERFYLDEADKNILHDEITVIDHALTRPWSIVRDLRRNPSPQPIWREFVCAEGNAWVRIGEETYFIGAAGQLMPMLKGQQPPDLRYFK